MTVTLPIMMRCKCDLNSSKIFNPREITEVTIYDIVIHDPINDL